MPWRLIIFLFLITLFIFFAGFNTHIVTVNLGIITLSNIPMFLALFIAFLTGALVALPFSIFSMAKKNKIKTEIHKRELEATLNNDTNTIQEQDDVINEPAKYKQKRKTKSQ